MKRRNKKLIYIKSLDLRRLKSIYIGALLVISCLLGRLVYLQFFNSEYLRNKAIAIQIKKTDAIKKRRTIVDRNDRVIAFDKPVYRLWAHPKYFNFPGDSSSQIRTIEEVTKKLSPILNVTEDELLSKFIDKKQGIELFDALNQEEARNIKNLQISGLDLEIYSKRFYPQGNLFSNIVGFVNFENKPASGLELHLNNKIKVFNKSNLLKKGADGTPLPDNSGPDDFIYDDKKIVLTLDSRLQKISFDILAKQVRDWGAKKGFSIVMDVNNGEILSLVSVPSYDPNKFWKYNQNLFRVWYLQDLFEPGSTFKPINLALALEEKVIEKDGFVQDDGNVNVGGWNLTNWDKKGNGYINYPKVLQVSSNIGMVKIMKNLDPSIYWDWLNKIGISEKIKTDIYESTPGYLKEKEIFMNQPIEQAVTSFGQGFSISPIKLAQLHALLANGGYKVSPHVTFDFQEKNTTVSKNKLFASDVTKTVLEWMETVVNKGSGVGAKIDGYRIGGKTGTSQKAFNGIYTNKKVCSFVAVFPVDKPKYLVLTVIDEPSRAYSYGSTVAVPVVKDIIESLIVLKKIPPSLNKMIVKKP